MKPNIAIYSICYNEEYMLPFYLEHYQVFAEAITIIDNHSTDNSVAIAKAAGVNVEYFESGNEIRDDIMQTVKNTCWTRSKGVHDWVIVVDIDELLYHDNLMPFLQHNNHITMFDTTGYHMLCDKLPVFGCGALCKQVRYGSPDVLCNKPCMFNPAKLAETGFTVGCHGANPIAEVNRRSQRNRRVRHSNVLRRKDTGQLKLLHYDYLTLDYRIQKCQRRGKRQSALNREQRWATQYDQSVATLTDDYHQKYKSAIIVC